MSYSEEDGRSKAGKVASSPYRNNTFGRYQWLQYVLQVWPAFMAGMHMLSQVEIGATPKHRCLFSNASSYLINLSRNSGNNWNRSVTSQDTLFSSESCFVSSTNRSANDITFIPNEIYTEVVPCDAWEFDTTDYGTTIVTEWNLVCDRRWLAAIAQTVYMLGCIIGTAVLGEFSDRYGRRTLLVPVGFLQLVLSVASGFFNQYGTYIAVRFLTAINTSAGFLIGFVMTMEMVSTNLRATMGFTFQIAFALGLATVGAWGYLIRDWHTLQIVYGLHGLPMILYYWFLDESPKWLLSRNRTKEAEAIVTKILICNGLRDPSEKCVLTVEQIQEVLMELPGKQCASGEPSNSDDHKPNLTVGNTSNESNNQKNQKVKQNSYGALDLFRKPRMRLRMINVSFAWLASCLGYYGLSMSYHVLSGDPHLMLFMSGLLEIPPLIVLSKIIDWVGRRAVISVSLGIGGLACIVTPFFPQTSHHAWAVAAICAVTIGKSSIGVALAVAHNYTAELFPTVVRSSAVGIAAAVGRVAASITPLIFLLDFLSPRLPSIIFGSLSVISCFLTLFLPETKGSQLIHSIEDGEEFGIGDHCFSSCYTKSKAKSNKLGHHSNANNITSDFHEPMNKKSHENSNSSVLLGHDNPLAVNDELSLAFKY